MNKIQRKAWWGEEWRTRATFKCLYFYRAAGSLRRKTQCVPLFVLFFRYPLFLSLCSCAHHTVCIDAVCVRTCARWGISGHTANTANILQLQEQMSSDPSTDRPLLEKMMMMMTMMMLPLLLLMVAPSAIHRAHPESGWLATPEKMSRIMRVIPVYQSNRPLF